MKIKVTIQLIRQFLFRGKMKVYKSCIYIKKPSTEYTYKRISLQFFKPNILAEFKTTKYYDIIDNSIDKAFSEIRLTNALDNCVMLCKLVEFTEVVLVLSLEVMIKEEYKRLEPSLIEYAYISTNTNLSVPICLYSLNYFNGSPFGNVNKVRYSLSCYITIIRGMTQGHLPNHVFSFFKAIGDVLCFESTYLEGNTIFGGGLPNAEYNLVDYASHYGVTYDTIMFNKPYYIYACYEAAMYENFDDWVEGMDYDDDLDNCIFSF